MARCVSFMVASIWRASSGPCVLTGGDLFQCAVNLTVESLTLCFRPTLFVIQDLQDASNEEIITLTAVAETRRI